MVLGVQNHKTPSSVHTTLKIIIHPVFSVIDDKGCYVTG